MNPYENLKIPMTLVPIGCVAMVADTDVSWTDADGNTINVVRGIEVPAAGNVTVVFANGDTMVWIMAAGERKTGIIKKYTTSGTTVVGTIYGLK